MSDRTVRWIRRLASGGDKSASEIKAQVQSPLSLRQIQRIISADPTLTYISKLHSPRLERVHLVRRVAFSRWYLTHPEVWQRIIYSDEKRFNLDGPDKWHKYWSDERKPKRTYITRQQGGGGVMIWAAFSSTGKTQVAFCSNRLNSIAYTQILEQHLIPYANIHYNDNYLYQQDNATPHVSQHSRAWFAAHNIWLIDWPARSPDLNPIENLWSILARKVYRNGQRQFDSVDELKLAIVESWGEIQVETLTTLVESMSQRCLDCVATQGKKVAY